MVTSPGPVTEHGRLAASRYGGVHDEYVACARQLEDLLTRWLDAEGINYLAVSARAKTVESFRRKASKVAEDGKSPRYQDPLTEVNDLLGARVITYLPESVDRVCGILRHEFEVTEEDDKGERTRRRGGFGYASRHLLAQLDAERASRREYSQLSGKVFEVQVRTAAQHAWAEYEHDLRYKGAIPEDRKPEFDRRFTLAAALMELADNEFTEIDRLYRELESDAMQEARRAVRQPRPGRLSHVKPETVDLEAPLDVPTLVNWLTEHYGEAPKSKREQYAWMVEILSALEVRTPTDLDRLLREVDTAAVNEAMRHLFPASQIRRLDDDLLAALGEAYGRRTGVDEVRAAQLRDRLQKLRRR